MRFETVTRVFDLSDEVQETPSFFSLIYLIPFFFQG